MKILDHAVTGTVSDDPSDAVRARELLAVAGYFEPTSAATAPSSFGSGFGFGPEPDPTCSPSDSWGEDLPAAIRRFQAEVVGMDKPDGRIDPGGGTMTHLVAQARKKVFLEDRISKQYSDPRITAALNAAPPTILMGGIEKPHLIAARTLEMLRMLGYCCGLQEMKITEGIRSYEMMASYFLRKITNGTRGVRGQSYKHALEILNEHNKGEPYARGKVPAEHIKAVADKMRERCEAANVRVSMHVVSEADYRQLNVIDLGFNSNPLLKERNRARAFARLLDDFHAKNSAASHRCIRTYYPPHKLNSILSSPYGIELKVENAWHIEFTVAALPSALG